MSTQNRTPMLLNRRPDAVVKPQSLVSEGLRMAG
jgi:hypothetical protein